jgi:hypothetical protein
MRPSRKASSPRKTRLASTSTRSAPGGPGTPTSRCRCWPWLGCPPPAPRPQKGNRRQQPGHDRLHVTGNPAPAHQPRLALPPRSRTRPGLVKLAAETPIPSPSQPLPPTRLCPHLTAVAVQRAGCRGAGAEDEGEHDLQFVQDLVEGHPGAGAFGSVRIMVMKAWARAVRVTWRCQPV